MLILATAYAILFLLFLHYHPDNNFRIYITTFIYSKNKDMKQVKLLLLIIACVNIFAACKKDKSEPTELSKLPAATQTGAKTFGCLVNGNAFIPDNGCNFLCTPAFRAYYDNSNGGTFSVRADLTSPSQLYDMYIGFGVNNCTTAKTYTIGNSVYTLGVTYWNYKEQNTNCTTFFGNDTTLNRTGFIKVEKIDLINGIISGEFEFTIKKNACETINITNGRFDAKL